MRCGELLDPAFGSVEYNSDTVGSIARYSCNAGYMLSGDEPEPARIPECGLGLSLHVNVSLSMQCCM